MNIPDNIKRLVLEMLFEAGYISEEELEFALEYVYVEGLIREIREMRQEYEENAKAIHNLKINVMLRDNDIEGLDKDDKDDDND